MNVKAATTLRKMGCSLMLAALAVALLWPATAAHACACCAERGTWFERTASISDYEMTEFNRLRFDALASIFMRAGEDQIKGILNPADAYTFSLSRRQRRWELGFKDKAGRAGTLSLMIPATAVHFGADMHDGQDGGGGGPLLYKEWRVTGALKGTGIFKNGVMPQTRFRLILQGRGNNCTSAEDFKSWTLQVFGPRTSYSFYGSFKEPAAQTAQQ